MYWVIFHCLAALRRFFRSICPFRTDLKNENHAPVLECLETRRLLSVSVSGPSTIAEGSTYTLELSTDSPTADFWTINWGDGTIDTVPATETTASHVFDDGFFLSATSISAGLHDANGVTWAIPTPGNHGVLEDSFDLEPEFVENLAVYIPESPFFPGPWAPDVVVTVGTHHHSDLATVRRNNWNGAIEFPFGFNPGDGRVDLDFGSDISRGIDVKVQPDEKIVVLGQAVNGALSDYVIVRLTQAGQLDQTFNGTGMIVKDIAAADEPTSIELLPDGRILVGGGAGDFQLAMYLANGQPDLSFGDQGVVTGLVSGYVHDMAVQADGSILLVGTNLDNDAESQWLVARFDPDGALDTTFQNAGTLLIDLPGQFDGLNRIALEEDGNIVLGGTTEDVLTLTDFALMRLLHNGNPDLSFGDAGLVTTDISGNDQLRALTVTPDHRIVASGAAGVDGVTYPVMVRYEVDGSLDLGFGSDEGKAQVGGAFPVDGIHAVTAQVPLSDGRVIIAVQNRVLHRLVRTHDHRINIYNAPPTAQLIADPINTIGPVIVRFQNPTDPSQSDVNAGFTYSYDFNNDGVFEIEETNTPFAEVPPEYLLPAGTHTVKGRIRDKDNASTEYEVDIDITETDDAAIEGILFEDLDGDGAQDAGEPFLEGWDVFLTRQGSDLFNFDEHVMTTDADGHYRFDNLEGNLYRVDIRPGLDWKQTNPLPTHDVGGSFVSYGDRIDQLDASGELVRSITVPYGDEATRPTFEDVRDVVVDRFGRIYVYNGTLNPYLSAYDPWTSTWQHRQIDGWGTVNGTGYGGMAIVDSMLFITDTAISGAAERGLIRLDLTDGTVTRFSENYDYVDVHYGLDGRLYALRSGGRVIDIFDPYSMVNLLSRALPSLGLRSIAGDIDGSVIGVSWGDDAEIHRLHEDGSIESVLTGRDDLIDVDVSRDGQIWITAFGATKPIITDRAFSSFAWASSISTASTGGTFITWDLPASPTPPHTFALLPGRQAAADFSVERKQPPFEIIGQSNPDGQAVHTPGGNSPFTVEFNDDIAFGSLDETDIHINGIPALSLKTSGSREVRFTFPPLPDGMYEITIERGAIVNRDGQSLEAFSSILIFDSTPHRVESMVINEGDAQRSMVTSLTYHFSKVVSVPNDAFVLENLTTGEAVAFSDMTRTFSEDRQAYTWTFPGLDGQSLLDGYYAATMGGGFLDGDGDGVAGDDHVSSFYRYFGDTNGDSEIGVEDLLEFRDSYLLHQSHPSYRDYFDNDQDGVIDVDDLLQFRSRYLSFLPPPGLLQGFSIEPSLMPLLAAFESEGKKPSSQPTMDWASYLELDSQNEN